MELSQKSKLKKEIDNFCFDFFNSNGLQEDNILLERILINFSKIDPKQIDYNNKFFKNLTIYINKLKEQFLNKKEKITGHNNFVSMSVHDQKTLPMNIHENLSKNDLNVLLAFYPEKTTPKAKKLFMGKTGLKDSCFYNHRIICLENKFLKIIDPGSPSLLKVEKDLIFILSRSLGISPDEFEVPIDLSDFPEFQFSKPKTRPPKIKNTPIPIRTHRIRMHVPIQCDKTYFHTMMSAYSSWIIYSPFGPSEIKKTDCYRIPAEITEKDGKMYAPITLNRSDSTKTFSFSAQFYHTNITIYLQEVWGIEAYDNMEIVNERILLVIEYLKEKFPKINFELDPDKWISGKKSLLDHTEHSIPGHAFARVANFLKTPPKKYKDHDGKWRIGWDNSKGPELEVFRADLGPDDIDQIMEDYIFQLENKVTVRLIYEFLINKDKELAILKQNNDNFIKIIMEQEEFINENFIEIQKNKHRINDIENDIIEIKNIQYENMQIFKEKSVNDKEIHNYLLNEANNNKKQFKIIDNRLNKPIWKKIFEKIGLS